MHLQKPYIIFSVIKLQVDELYTQPAERKSIGGLIYDVASIFKSDRSFEPVILYIKIRKSLLVVHFY